MSEKIFSPGETVEDSGLYPVVGPDGDSKGYEVTVVEGEPFPPTPEKGWGFGAPRLAKTTHLKETRDVGHLPPPLPNGRPIFQGNSAHVPSSMLLDGRPIFENSKAIMRSEHLPLRRPIFSSHLEIAAMHNKRPIIRESTNLVPSASLPENEISILSNAWIWRL